MFSDERLNEQERYLKRKDPETFLYMMVLRLIGRNPDAKVTNSNYRCFATLDLDDDGNTRFEGAVLGRHKRRPRDGEFINKDGVVNRVGLLGVEGEVDEFIQRRAEFGRYCQKLVDAAVKE